MGQIKHELDSMAWHLAMKDFHELEPSLKVELMKVAELQKQTKILTDIQKRLGAS